MSNTWSDSANKCDSEDSEMCYNMQRSSRFDVTTATRPIPPKTRSWDQHGAFLRTFLPLRKRIKIRGFNQIKKFLHQNTPKTTFNFFWEKHVLRLGAL